MAQPPPEVLALVVADHAHRDDETNKVSILGTRYLINARECPWTHDGWLAVYVALTNGRGETTLRVRLIDADEEREAVAEEEIVLSFENPVDEIDLALFLTDLVFPAPGSYRVQLFADGQFLRERMLAVILHENPDPS